MSARARAGLRAAAGLALVALPLVAVIAQVIAAAADVPVLDDFDAILHFATAFAAAPSGLERLELLFANHIEHRPAVARAIAVLCGWGLRQVDFGCLNLVGALCLVPLAFALAASARGAGDFGSRALRFAPAALFAFQPQYGQIFSWAMASLPNVGVTACAAGSLAALARTSRGSLAWAFLLALLALFSQGNGILVPPAGAAMLWLSGRRRRAWHWLLGCAPLVALFSISYQRPPRAAEFALADPFALFLYALNFAGSAAGFRNAIASPIAGAGLLVSSVAIVWLGIARRASAVAAMLLFLLGSVALNALLRVGLGPDSPLGQPRYTFYASVLLAAVYLGLVELLREHRCERAFARVALALALVFSVASFAQNSDEIGSHANFAKSELERWWSSGEGGLLHPRPERAEAVLIEALRRGSWRLPEALLRRAADPALAAVPPAHPEALDAALALAVESGSYLVAEGAALTPRKGLWQDPVLILLGEKRSYEIRTRSVCCPGAADRDAPPRSRFRVVSSSASLERGLYRIGILRRGARTQALWLSGQSLELR